MPPTHEVFNQVPPLIGYDVADDPAMLDALRREGAGWAEPEVRSIGRRVPGPRAGPRRRELLPAAPHAAGRHP